MAFADLGSLGATGSTGNNQASLALTLGATGVAVGELVVIVVADDNIGTGADADGGEVASVADSGGNTWFKARGWTLTTGGAQNGAAVSLWWTWARFAIAATTGTITATFTNATLSDATAMTARHFSVGNRMAVAATNQSTQTAGTDPSSLNAVTPNIACLRIRGFACEVGNNTNLTPTSNWTAWANGNSATSGTILEMVARAEHHISTGTGDASDPTYAVTADYAHVYVAFMELAPQDFDWPNPSLGRVREGVQEASRAQQDVWVNRSPALLQGQDRVYGGPGQVADYDWPNPQNRLAAGAHIALRAEADVTQVSQALYYVAPAIAYTPRSPLILEGRAPPRAGEFPPQALLLTTLGGAAPPADTTNTTRSPIFLRGWPPPSSISLLTWTDQTKRQLIGLDTFFDGAGRAPVYDWPNPRGPRPTISLLSWTQSLAEALKPPFAQTNWPNPRGPVPGISLTWTQSLAQFLKSPFAQINWPNPRGPLQPAPAYADTLKPWLQVTVRPLVQSDWPNPRSKPVIDLTWTQSRFARPDTFYGLAGAINFDWPNPRGAAYPVALRGFVGPITQPPAEPAVSYTFRAPVVSFSWPQPRPAFDSLNLLTSTLGGPVAPPIRPIDWPNPQRHGPRTAPLHFRPKPGEDVVVVALPFIPVFWPNPGLVRDAFSAQIQPQRVAFSGLDTFFGEPGQVRPFDWPNPRGPQHPVSLRTHIGLFPILTYTPPVFFGLAGHPNFDWPNPSRGPAYPISARGSVQPQNRPLLDAPVVPPLRPFDWPNPQRHLPRSAPLHFRPKPGEDVIVVTPPFIPISWANPQRPQGALYAQIQPQRITFIGFDTFFGAPGQAPTYVLPNPRGYVPSISLKTWTDQTKLNLIGKDTFFGAPGQTKVYDWPNPRGALFSIGLRTHVDLLKILTYVPPPQVQSYVLPNPLGPIFPVSLRSHLVPLNLLAGKDRFFGLAGHPNFNWPNPVLPGIFRQEGTLGENRPLYGGGVVTSTAEEWIIRARRRGRR